MIKILLLAVVPFITQHRNVVLNTEVSTNFYGSVTGIVDKAYIEARVGVGGGGGCDTNTVDALANSAVVTNALTVATTNRVALLESSKADKSALEGKVSWDSDHLGVDLGDGYLSAGPYSLLGSDSTIGSNATINDNALIGNTSGGSTFIGGWLHFSPERKLFSPALFTMGDQLIYTTDFGNSVMLYFPSKSGTIATTDDITNSISETNTVFSNAVLAVGLNIDTNSVAVLNEIAATFGGFPLGAGETATTVGALLAALAAAVAWLKKNKVGSFDSVGGATATVESGVAKLDGFFTESNSLLNGRLAYSRNATGLKDRAFNALTFDGTEYNLSTALAAVTPTASGQPRDLLIVATATAATTISFTAGTIKGDKPTIDGSGTWLITLTEYASGVWYCRQIKMEDAV